MHSPSRADGSHISYQFHGSGPFLCLIHGWSGSSASFQRNVDQLAQRFTVLTYDQRFHGASGKSGEHTVAQLAGDLHQLLQHVQASSPISLLGTSMVRPRIPRQYLLGGLVHVAVSSRRKLDLRSLHVRLGVPSRVVG